MDPVRKFWGGIECAVDESSFRYILEEMVRDFRVTLPDSSPTAQSIDNEDSLCEIAEHAREEGLDDFADALSFAQKE